MKVQNLLFGPADKDKLAKKERFAVISGLLYLFIVADAYFTWRFDNALLLRGFAFALLCLASLYVHNQKGFGLDANKVPFFCAFSLYLLVFILFRCDNLHEIAFRILAFGSVLLLVLWPRRLIYKLYRWYFYIVLFFASGAAVISILGGFGLLQYLPYFELPPRSALHERLGYVYHICCGFLIINGETSITSIPRACGFLQEPGHFAITLGLIYIIERLQKHAPNPILILCGVLTFSSNFIIMAVLVECLSIKKTKYLKILRYAIVTILAVCLGYGFLPEATKQEINYLFLERNLTSVFATLSETGSMQEALNERINASGGAGYENFVETGNIWLGKSATALDEDEILSDYRGVIYTGGLVSLFTIILCAYTSVKSNRLAAKMAILGALGLVLLHRSWMFSSPYLFMLAFMGGIVQKRTKSIVRKKGKTQKKDFSY